MSETAPETTPAAPAEPPKPGPPKAEQRQEPPWGKPENFDPDKAWDLIQGLKADKAKRGETNEELRQRLARVEGSAVSREDLAKALGVMPESISDADKVSEQIKSMQNQILASERRALAAEHKVPEALLTAQDAEGMRAQAESLVAFANAAHVAAVSAQPTEPVFQPNPGQGMGGGTPTSEAQAAAEYEKYYPSK